MSQDNLFPLCYFCKHRLKDTGVYSDEIILRCLAFPKNIPKTILNHMFDHRFPHPLDNGIHFEPAERYREQYLRHDKFTEIPERNDLLLETLYVMELTRRYGEGLPPIITDQDSDDFPVHEQVKLSYQVNKAVNIELRKFHNIHGHNPDLIESEKIRFKEELRIRRQSTSLKAESSLFFYLAGYFNKLYKNSIEAETLAVQLYLEVADEKRLLQIFRQLGEKAETYLREAIYPRMKRTYPTHLLDDFERE